jgi:rhodanese-related sulfurtransferase
MGILDMLFGKGVSAADLKELYKNGAMIVDVRTPAEFNQGHIKNSINIPLQSLQQNIQQLKQKNKPVITVCLSGGRSSNAATILKNAGIEAHNGGPWTSMQNIIG